MTKVEGGGGRKSQKNDDVFYERPLIWVSTLRPKIRAIRVVGQVLGLQSPVYWTSQFTLFIYWQILYYPYQSYSSTW